MKEKKTMKCVECGAWYEEFVFETKKQHLTVWSCPLCNDNNLSNQDIKEIFEKVEEMKAHLKDYGNLVRGIVADPFFRDHFQNVLAELLIKIQRKILEEQKNEKEKGL